MKNPKTSALEEELRENRPLPLYADDLLLSCSSLSAS